MDLEDARKLLALILDSLDINQHAQESATCRQLGNSEYVVILETAACQWFLWSHEDFQALRRRTKKSAQQQRIAAGKVKRKRKKQAA